MPTNKSRREIENAVKIYKNMTILAISALIFDIDINNSILYRYIISKFFSAEIMKNP